MNLKQANKHLGDRIVEIELGVTDKPRWWYHNQVDMSDMVDSFGYVHCRFRWMCWMLRLIRRFRYDLLYQNKN